MENARDEMERYAAGEAARIEAEEANATQSAHWHGNCPLCDVINAEVTRLRAHLAALQVAIEAYHAKFQDVATCPDDNVADGHAMMLKLARTALADTPPAAP